MEVYFSCNIASGDWVNLAQRLSVAPHAALLKQHYVEIGSLCVF